jgi:hypothetical protein
MPTVRRVFSIFLASPGDLKPEREAARDIVNAINSTLQKAGYGWQIELQRWEETSPGFGRPQELINEMVDDCELFVGILWERWGQPTGLYSSGFEEEFERAKARRLSSGVPEVWLVFKSISPEKAQDPGPQLTKVLEFKNREIELRHVLFHEVKDFEDWKAKFQNWLWEHILKVIRKGEQEAASQENASPVQTLSLVPETQVGGLVSTNGVPEQVQLLPKFLTRALQDPNLEFTVEEQNHSTEFDIARMFLLAFTWLSGRYTAETLSVHQVNLLYKFRDRLVCTPQENAQLLRSLVVDTGDVIPGWFWFQDTNTEEMTNELMVMATADVSDRIRERSIRFMTAKKLLIPRERYVELPLSDDNSDVRSAAFRYLASLGDESALSLLEAIQANDATMKSSELSFARLTLLSRFNPVHAFKETLSRDTYLGSDETNIFKECVSSVSDEDLAEALGDGFPDALREISLREFVDRGTLPTERAKALIADSSKIVRAIALESLAKSGSMAGIDAAEVLKEEQPYLNLLWLGGLSKSTLSMNADAIKLDFFMTQPFEALMSKIRWYSVEAQVAYKALALSHFGEFAQQIRADLSD